MVSVAHPFLKYAGGKTALLPEILPRLPAKIKTYYEPFLGGGAVFFAIAAEERFEHAFLTDASSELMSAYSAVAGSASAVVHLLEKYAKKHSEDHYYRVRGLDKEKNFAELIAPIRAARFIYLNRTCFNGLHRVNKSGHFNVPFGSYLNPMICDEENLYAVQATLEKASIQTMDFEEAIRTAEHGDAVYFDPPYSPASKTANFTSYTKGGFTADDQERLRDTMVELDSRGVHVLLSNSDTPLARALYADFKIEEVRAPRRVNSKGGKRENVGELLISGCKLGPS